MLKRFCDRCRSDDKVTDYKKETPWEHFRLDLCEKCRLMIDKKIDDYLEKRHIVDKDFSINLLQ